MFRDIPYRRGSSDVGALMTGIFFAAVAMLFFSRVQLYAPLRSAGATVEGTWVDGFIQAKTEFFEGYYRFEVDGASYRGRQVLSSDAYSGDGQAVSVRYLPENPKVSRALGGEAITAGDAIGLALSLAGFIFSMQHILAYYRGRPSWVIFLRRTLLRMIGRST